MTPSESQRPEGGSPGPAILVVEDEAPILKFLRASLSAHGFRYIEARNGAEALRFAADHMPDAILLDLGLPDMDGIDVTKRLREWSTIPIVVVSARGRESDKVAALDAGADDYLTKPFGVPELMARLRAVMRRGPPAGAADGKGGSVFTVGPLRVDLAAHRVFIGGDETHLTPIEFRILATLVRHAGKLVTHAQLLASVWGPRSGAQPHYLRVYMTHLRRKLEKNASARILQTEVGIGYRLNVDDSP